MMRETYTYSAEEFNELLVKLEAYAPAWDINEHGSKAVFKKSDIKIVLYLTEHRFVFRVKKKLFCIYKEIGDFTVRHPTIHSMKTGENSLISIGPDKWLDTLDENYGNVCAEILYAMQQKIRNNHLKYLKNLRNKAMLV